MINFFTKIIEFFTICKCDCHDNGAWRNCGKCRDEHFIKKKDECDKKEI